MLGSPVTWITSYLPGDVLQLTFRGRGGIGSAGNPDGEQMREAIQAAVADKAPAGLVIDLTEFEYRFGDWIGDLAVAAVKVVGTGRVCLLATGETAGALRSLWKPSRLDRIIPVFGQMPEALRYISGVEAAS